MHRKEQDHKLIPTQPTHQVHGPELMLHPPRQRDEHLVTDCMAQVVIDLLEAITVQIEQGEALLPGAPGLDGLLQPRLEQRPVGQTGEGIMGRLVQQGGVLPLLMGLPGFQLVEQ
ncbi:hypothetical protein D3C75_1015430 [compost metagenome]